jgi:uncharacterized protein YdeI (YjbR/CyaY-like superfamily)
MPLKATFFPTPADFRAWLEKNHTAESELLVGFYKKDSGKRSITWPESVDAALCFGWIDGIRRRIDESSYSIRFTPRRRRSIWSAINIARVRVLTEMELMHPAGAAVFARRTSERSAIYSYEQRKTARLPSAEEKKFRARKSAWKFFTSRPPSYQRTAIWWVISAKKEETRAKRLARLISLSARGLSLDSMNSSKSKH